MSHSARERELHTRRLWLRNWHPGDRAPFAALNADPAVMEHFPALLSPTESDILVDRITAHWEAQGFGLWVVEITVTGEFAGFVGLSQVNFRAHFTPAVEVGWRLARRFWHQGYATEAAQAALTRGFHDLELTEIVSFTTESNLRSRRVMERLGMHQNERDDFRHPNLPADHPLSPHVLYRLTRSEGSAAGASDPPSRPAGSAGTVRPRRSSEPGPVQSLAAG